MTSKKLSQIAIAFLIAAPIAWGAGNDLRKLHGSSVINGSGVLSINSSGTVTIPNQTGTAIIAGNASIVNADINASAAIVDTKLATISTAGKVSNSATTATALNTASAIMARDGSGQVAATTFTGALTGNVTGNVTGNLTGNASGTAASVTGIVAKANGGTAQDNSSLTFPSSGTVPAFTPTNHGVVVSGSGAAATVTATGTSGQPLLSAGSGADPAYGTLGVAGGGTGLATLTANNVILGNGTSAPSFVAPSTSGNLLTSNGTTWVSSAPGAVTYTAPTVQKFLATGTTTGYVFTITSATVAVGCVFSNNSNNYTVLGAITAGTQLFTSQANAPQASGTLTYVSGGAGCNGAGNVSFSAARATATYTTPTSPAPLYIIVKAMGGGGGGGGSPGGSGGTNATATLFGPNLISSGGGSSPGAVGYVGGGAGGTSSIATSSTVVKLLDLTGGRGMASKYLVGNATGEVGGISFYGGQCTADIGSTSSQVAPVANQGSGGCGSGTTTADHSGAGGGAGNYTETRISGASLAATFPYAIGAGGAAGTAGTNGVGPTAGASGQLSIEEHYQ